MTVRLELAGPQGIGVICVNRIGMEAIRAELAAERARSLDGVGT